MGLFKFVLDSMLHPNKPIDFSPDGGGFDGTPWGGRGRGRGGRGRGAHGGAMPYVLARRTDGPRVEPILGPDHAQTIVAYDGGRPFGPYEAIWNDYRGRVNQLPYSMRDGPRPDGQPGWRERWEEEQAHDPEVQEFMARLPQHLGGAAGRGGANGGGRGRGRGGAGTHFPQEDDEDDDGGWAAGSQGGGHSWGGHGRGGHSHGGGHSRGGHSHAGSSRRSSRRGGRGGHRGRGSYASSYGGSRGGF